MRESRVSIKHLGVEKTLTLTWPDNVSSYLLDEWLKTQVAKAIDLIAMERDEFDEQG